MRDGPWELRRAVGADAMAVAAVHVRSWQVAYRGIVPDGFLRALDVSGRAARYTFDLAGPADPVTWLAVEDERVVGFVSLGPARDDDLHGLGEVRAIYVDPERWGSGLGAVLLARAERLLVDDGFAEAFLWVLADNERARRFYAARGWRTDGCTKTVEIGGRPLGEVRYRKVLSGTG